jgi:tRNA threonylcarbamoyladenosine biosynthesis protein TsaE
MGDLGTGKTQFVSGICEALDAHGHVGSPTFTLINEYPTPFGAVVHVDMYRLNAREEIREIGLEEYFNDRSICVVEWAERVLDFLPKRHYAVRMEYGPTEMDREISIAAPEEAET